MHRVADGGVDLIDTSLELGADARHGVFVVIGGAKQFQADRLGQGDDARGRQLDALTLVELDPAVPRAVVKDRHCTVDDRLLLILLFGEELRAEHRGQGDGDHQGAEEGEGVGGRHRP